MIMIINYFRWNVSVPNNEYIGYNMRTLEKMKECVSKKGIDNIKGCVNLPLINVEPKYCVVDELHLFLRITDILYEIFLQNCIDWITKQKLLKLGVTIG